MSEWHPPQTIYRVEDGWWHFVAVDAGRDRYIYELNQSPVIRYLDELWATQEVTRMYITRAELQRGAWGWLNPKGCVGDPDLQVSAGL